MLDAALDALALTLAARLAGWRIRVRRIALGALAGAGIALAVRSLPPLRGMTALFWLPTALCMMAVAFGRRALVHPLRSAALLLCTEGLLGGIVQALLGATGSFALACAAGAVCTVCIMISVLRQRRAVRTVQSLRVRCRYRGRMAEFDAIADSGNTLRDYLTQLPVIVLPEDSARTRLQLGDTPLRPIFADTAGGRQMMGCLLPQEIRLDMNGEERSVRALAALSGGLRVDAPALVPAALLAAWETDGERNIE